MLHFLKTWPEFFQEIRGGQKTADLRKNDRGYQVGDILLLNEYEPEGGRYTGRDLRCEVTHVLGDEQFGLQPGFVMLSLKAVG